MKYSILSIATWQRCFYCRLLKISLNAMCTMYGITRERKMYQVKKRLSIRNISFLHFLLLQMVWQGNIYIKNQRTESECPLHHLPTVSSMSSSVNTDFNSTSFIELMWGSIEIIHVTISILPGIYQASNNCCLLLLSISANK